MLKLKVMLEVQVSVPDGETSRADAWDAVRDYADLVFQTASQVAATSLRMRNEEGTAKALIERQFTQEDTVADSASSSDPGQPVQQSQCAA